VLKPEDLFYAMPNVPEQLVAQEMSKYTEYMTVSAIEKNGAVMAENVKANDRQQKYSILCTTYAR